MFNLFDFRALLALIALTLGYFYFKNRKSRQLLAKIPSPKGWPIIGNLNLFIGSDKPTTQNAFNVFKNLCNQYDNEGIFKFTVAGKTTVVLFKPETIEGL